MITLFSTTLLAAALSVPAVVTPAQSLPGGLRAAARTARLDAQGPAGPRAPEKRDSLRNGAIVGAVSGAASMAVAGGAACAAFGGDCAGGVALLTAAGAGLGALIGVGVDAMFERSPYAPPGGHQAMRRGFRLRVGF